MFYWVKSIKNKMIINCIKTGKTSSTKGMFALDGSIDEMEHLNDGFRRCEAVNMGA